MTPDPNRRSLRQFQCRDYLWEAFEQMAQEQGCVIDSLLNEAMRQYARSRDRGGPMADMPEQLEPALAPAPTRAGPGAPGANPGGFRPGAPPPAVPGRATNPGAMRPAPGALGPNSTRPPGMPPMPGAAPIAGAPPRLPPMAAPGGSGPARTGMPTTPPMGPARSAPGNISAPRPPGAPPRPMPAPAPAPAPMPMPMPMAAPPMSSQAKATNTLFAMYEGQSYPVQKEEFIIGRGQKTSDLTIRDSNVSRRHACVVLFNSQYWIVDQQSTNGVEYKGAKIDRKVVEDGDVYKICDHEIRFTYR